MGRLKDNRKRNKLNFYSILHAHSHPKVLCKWEKNHFIFLGGTQKGKEKNFLLKVNAKLALSCKVVDGNKPCVLYSYWDAAKKI